MQLEVAWSPDGSQLMVSGETSLGIVKRNTWELTYSKEVGHKKEISCIQWLSEETFATAGLDNMIKIWDAKTMKLLYFIQAAREITSLQYCQKVR